MKILWVSNPLWANTGYGRASAAVVPRIKAMGHEIVVLSSWGHAGGQIVFDGIRHYPPGRELHANDVIASYASALGADVTIILRDAFVNAAGIADQINLAIWSPIDHEPLSPVMKERFGEAQWAATMSEHAQHQCWEAGLDKVVYLPHSVDPAVFTPDTPEQQGASIRSQLHTSEGPIPEDAFLVSMVGANTGWPARKGWPEMFQALRTVLEEHPNAYAYAHTNASKDDNGPDLNVLASVYELPASRLTLLNPTFWYMGISESWMAQLYRESDVLLHTSYGEGFGMGLLEAQACGTPVITTDFSAMSEMTFEGSYRVDGTLMSTAHYANWMLPNVDMIDAALDALYIRWDKDEWEAKERQLAVAEYIATDWNHDAIFDKHWVPWLKKIEQDLADKDCDHGADSP